MNISDPAFHLAGALALPENEVQLWRLELESLAAGENRWHQLLSVDERARAARFRVLRVRQEFVATRALLRLLLAAYLGVDAAQLAFRQTARNKPNLDAPHVKSGISFNVAHSGGVALLAFNRKGQIGVDVERVRHDVDVEAIAQRFFSANEQQQLATVTGDKYEAFFRCWTRKEAYVKAMGEGLFLPLDQFDVCVAAGTDNALLATRPDAAEAARWSLREVEAGPGYIAALCVAGDDFLLRGWDGTGL
jgi:4'-phosphopantetheinyl transferase